MESKIPKKIHYCWFGGNPLPDMALKCIESWKKFCPDYEIIEWNENNFDINYCNYVREAYEAKKWAFVSDVARLYALVNHGGIYMDTDVEILKSLNPILIYDAVSGFETDTQIPTGLMACCKGNALFREFLDDYDNLHFLKKDGSYDTTTNVVRITNKCLEYGLKLDNTFQTVNGFTLFPKDYFCPKDYETKETILTHNTYTIHHFDGSWHSDEQKYRNILYLKYRKFLPDKFAKKLARIIAMIKYKGLSSVIKIIIKRGK